MPFQVQAPMKISQDDLAAVMWPRPLRPTPAAVPTPPPPPRPNAERFPTLAAMGFVFSEGIDVGPVCRPAHACPTCGRLAERVSLHG